MKKNNIYCVYKHTRDDNDTIFYIGIGKSLKRAYKKGKGNRNKYWNNIVNKVGYKIDILFTNLIKDEAIAIEKYLIQYYGRKDLGTGSLCNMTDGGDGCFNPLVVNGSKRVINIFTQEVFNTITDAAISDDKCFVFLSNHLTTNKINKSDFLFYSNWLQLSQESRALLQSNILHYKYRVEKIINIKTLEIFDNLKLASKSINMDSSYLSKKLRGIYKNNTNMEYYRNFKYLEYAS